MSTPAAFDLRRYILSRGQLEHSIVRLWSPPDDWDVEISEKERGDLVLIEKGALMKSITQKGTEQGVTPIAISV